MLRKTGGEVVEITSSPDPRGYAKAKQAAKYAGVSERTFRDWLKDGLPHFRLSTGTILIAYKDIDSWLESFRVDGSRVDEIVDQVLTDL
jgi:excisionase family DNA binding protein